MKPEEARPERTPSLPLDCVQSEPQGGPSRIRACSLWRTKGECELDRIAEELGLEEGARKQARSVCYAVTGQRLVRGRTIGVVAACSVYVVCREARLPITLKELATSCNSTPGKLGKFYRTILDRMEMKPPTPSGTTYITKLVAKVHASDEVARLSVELENKALQGGMGGRSPMSLAAASLYNASLANGEPVTQADVAEAAGVGVLSLRETAKRMRSIVTLCSPPE